MRSDSTRDPSRRRAIRRGLFALAGIQIVAFTASRTSAAAAKLAKTAVSYVDVSTDKGKDCDDCIQFVAGVGAKGPGSCRIVEGDIDPHGHCIAFSSKPGRRGGLS